MTRRQALTDGVRALLPIVLAVGCSSPSPPPRVESPAPATRESEPATADARASADTAAPAKVTVQSAKQLGLDPKLAPWVDEPWVEDWAEMGIGSTRVKVCTPKGMGRNPQGHDATHFESSNAPAYCEKLPGLSLLSARGEQPSKEEVLDDVIKGSRIHRVTHSATETTVTSDYKWFRYRYESLDAPKDPAWLVSVTRVTTIKGDVIWCTAKCATLKESAVDAIGRALAPLCASLIESTNRGAVFDPDGACAVIGK